MLARFATLALPLALAVTAAAPLAHAEEAAEAAAAPLLAKKTGGKKKKKKAEEEDFGTDAVDAITDNDQGVGIHREQEGVDIPYIAEVAGLTDVRLFKTEPKDGDPTDMTLVSVNGQFLFILGSIEVGPDVDVSYSKYSMTVSTAATATSQATSETVEATDLSYTVGGLFKFNFGKVDKDLTVPFVYGGLGLRGSSTKAGKGDAEKTSGYQLKVGGGLNLFVDSNVAFTPRGEYVLISDKGEAKDGKEASEDTTSGLRLLFGIAVFI